MSYVFRGGVYFKGVTSPVGVMTAARAHELCLDADAGASPCVSVGERVLMGQPAAVSTDGTPALHIPASGRVTGIESDGSAARIIISCDAEDTVSPKVRKTEKKLSDCTPDEIIEKIRSAGIAEPDGASAADKLARAVGRAGVCVINCAECEPYVVSDEAAALVSTGKVINGLKIFLRALGVRKGVLAVSESSAELFKKLSAAVNKSPLFTVAKVSAKYPGGDERRVVYALTGREVPADGGTVELGYVVFNVQTCIAVYDAFVSGMPQISRVVTVAGDGVKKPVNVSVPIGTRFSDLAEYAGGTVSEPALILEGGPLRGTVTAKDGAVGKTTRAVLFFRESEREAADPVCIRCGRCVSACPEKLMPNRIYNAIMNGDRKAAYALGADLCSGCGICSYVCPGKAPVAELIRSMRGAGEAGVGADKTDKRNASDESVAAVEKENAEKIKDGEAEI